MIVNYYVLFLEQLLNVLSGIKAAIQSYLKTGHSEESLTNIFGRLVKQNLSMYINNVVIMFVN